MKINLYKAKKYNLSFYPIWRIPLVLLSYFIAYSFYLLKINPYILSFGMIILGVIGSFCIILLGKIKLGIFLLLLSYFVDLLDGKVARLLNKSNKNAMFIDWIYHPLVTSLAIFGIGYYLYILNGNIIYIILGGIISIIFLTKIIMQFIFVQLQEEINKNSITITKGNKGDGEFEKKIESTYGLNRKGIIFIIYHNFLRLFIDSTDILFGIAIFYFTGFLNEYFIILSVITTLLFFYSFITKFYKLYSLELCQKK